MQEKVVLDVDQFMEFWEKGEWPEEEKYSCEILLGRVCKGRNGEEFQTLTDHSKEVDRTAFCLVQDGWGK